MQRALYPFSILMALVGGACAPAAARGLEAARPVQDTIVVRLPNQATLTFTVRNTEQLRQLKNYHLDSLTSRLATYIAQAEAAAKAGPGSQVTMRFYPDKDQPGQHLPEEIRITARKPGTAAGAGTTRTQVFLNKKFGIVTHTDEDGKNSFSISTDGETKAKSAKSAADSVRKANHKDRSTVYLRFDIGLNTFVNSTPTSSSSGAPSLNYLGWGVGYTNFGLDFVQPLAYGKRTKLALIVGPEISTNRFQLRGNDQWLQDGARTFVDKAADVKQIHSSTLHVTTLNLPVLVRLKLRNKDDKRTLSAGIGAFGGYRLGSNVETEYRLTGNDYLHEDKTTGQLNLTNWQYGVQGELGFHALRFFAKYHLNELFQPGESPKTHTLSFGIRALGF